MGRLISEDAVMRMLTSVELNNGSIADAKTELSAIGAFNKKNKKRIKDKKVRLYNIFWKIGNDKYSDMEYEFCKNAQNLINEIIEENNPGIIDFKIDAFSVQEMLDKKHKLSEHIQFPDKVHIEINNRNNDILKKLHIENR